MKVGGELTVVNATVGVPAEPMSLLLLFFGRPRPCHRVPLVLLIRPLFLIPRGPGGCWDQAQAGGSSQRDIARAYRRWQPVPAGLPAQTLTTHQQFLPQG